MLKKIRFSDVKMGDTLVVQYYPDTNLMISQIEIVAVESVGNSTIRTISLANKKNRTFCSSNLGDIIRLEK